MCSVEECEAFVAEVKRKSPKIAKLLLGVKGEEPKIGCRPCSSTGAEGNARAALFDSDPLEVVLLSLIHISEPTRPLYISYAVFCLKKKNGRQGSRDSC